MYNDAEDFEAEGEFEEPEIIIGELEQGEDPYDWDGIECAFCGNDLAGERTVTRKVNGAEETFCDDDCADAFEEENA